MDRSFGGSPYSVERLRLTSQSQPDVHHRGRSDKCIRIACRDHFGYIWPPRVRGDREYVPDHWGTLFWTGNQRPIRYLHPWLPFLVPWGTLHLYLVVPSIQHLSDPLGAYPIYTNRCI